MGFLDRLFGTGDPDRQAEPVPRNTYPGTGTPSMQPPRSDDEIAIERYRYLLRTAPPEAIEQVHAEAFGKLTEAQRQQVLADLSAQLPDHERPNSADPRAMARAATRAEYLNPGFMERTLGNQGGGYRQGPSFGSMVGGSILGTVAGYVIGSALVSAFMAPAFADSGSDGSGGDGQDAGSDGGGEAGADSGGGDAGGYGDAGGGFDFGGGGDFGGGDFGGF